MIHQSEASGATPNFEGNAAILVIPCHPMSPFSPFSPSVRCLQLCQYAALTTCFIQQQGNRALVLADALDETYIQTSHISLGKSRHVSEPSKSKPTISTNERWKNARFSLSISVLSSVNMIQGDPENYQPLKGCSTTIYQSHPVTPQISKSPGRPLTPSLAPLDSTAPSAARAALDEWSRTSRPGVVRFGLRFFRRIMSTNTAPTYYEWRIILVMEYSML